MINTNLTSWAALQLAQETLFCSTGIYRGKDHFTDSSDDNDEFIVIYSLLEDKLIHTYSLVPGELEESFIANNHGDVYLVMTNKELE
jgi:hypothetical protein